MQISTQPRTVWMFVLRFAALIALSFAVLAGVSMARNDAAKPGSIPSVPGPDAHTETALV